MENEYQRTLSSTLERLLNRLIGLKTKKEAELITAEEDKRTTIMLELKSINEEIEAINGFIEMREKGRLK